MRGLSLLACFVPDTPELTLAELAQRTDLGKATAFRLLTSLVETGFLRRDPERNTYQVGPAVLPIASSFQQSTALAALADPHLRWLAEHTGQTATLAQLDDGTTVNIGLAYPDRPLRRMTYVGERLPLHSTSTGKAIAAAMRDEEIAAILELKGMPANSENTITEWSAFQVEIEKIRATGYAIDDEEAMAGLRCVGAVIRDYTSRPVAAVSVAGPSGEFGEEAAVGLGENVTSVAIKISGELGYCAPDAAPAGAGHESHD
ncbi:MAG TPA: IclR family transcriptional regulator [Chloroflexota bacterium]|nr:IclR family transcriptional regulator [Chloroflexota bacterium]